MELKLTKTQTTFIVDYIKGENNIGYPNSFTLEEKRVNELIMQIFKRIKK